MTILDKTNFVAFNLLANNNPITVRHRKLIAKEIKIVVVIT